MYNVVKRSSIHYKNIMQGEGYRESLIEPFILLTDTEIYYEAKRKNEKTYKNLCDIICRMKELHYTGEDKYHAFANYLREVEDAGFDINDMEFQNITESIRLDDQIELMRMLMCFKYCSSHG